jgi:hypothetical protein
MKTLTINLTQRVADTGKRITTRIYGIFKNRNAGNWLQIGHKLGLIRVYDGGDPDEEIKVNFIHPVIMWGNQSEIEFDFMRAVESEIFTDK